MLTYLLSQLFTLALGQGHPPDTRRRRFGRGSCPRRLWRVRNGLVVPEALVPSPRALGIQQGPGGWLLGTDRIAGAEHPLAVRLSQLSAKAIALLWVRHPGLHMLGADRHAARSDQKRNRHPGQQHRTTRRRAGSTGWGRCGRGPTRGEISHPSILLGSTNRIDDLQP